VKFVRAALIARDVEPGWELVNESVPLGREYIVDLDTATEMTMVHRPDGRSKTLLCVLTVVAGPDGLFRPTGWMPLFALRVEGDYDADLRVH
jgi:hypothetical protein